MWVSEKSDSKRERQQQTIHQSSKKAIGWKSCWVSQFDDARGCGSGCEAMSKKMKHLNEQVRSSEIQKQKH
jgi:hypothetical protein